MKADFVIREATLADLPVIVKHRRNMFEAMGFSDAAVMDTVQAASEAWTRQKMEQGEYLGWLVAGVDGRVIAGAGLWLQEICSNPRNVPGRVAYVMNVFTEAECRRQGWARKLMEAVIEWCRGKGYSAVLLHASDFGRPLYESMGFQPSTEMRMKLE